MKLTKIILIWERKKQGKRERRGRDIDKFKCLIGKNDNEEININFATIS